MIMIMIMLDSDDISFCRLNKRVLQFRLVGLFSVKENGEIFRN